MLKFDRRIVTNNFLVQVLLPPTPASSKGKGSPAKGKGSPPTGKGK